MAYGGESSSDRYLSYQELKLFNYLSFIVLYPTKILFPSSFPAQASDARGSNQVK